MNRRNMLKTTALAGTYAMMPKFSFAAVKGSDRIKVGVIGCSGRGISAVRDMLNADSNVCIVALADLFEDRIQFALDKFADYTSPKKAGEPSNYSNTGFPKECFDIPKERQFVGWDAYKKLLETDVDLIIHATPPVFRPMHLRACVEAGKHIFVEKPACVDAVQIRELYETAKLADEKKLCIIGGIQRRFHAGYVEGIKRIQDGDIGEILSTQCYWLNSRFFIQKLNTSNPDPESMEYQIRNWFIFTWASGDSYVEQHVHNLDIILWGLNGKKPKEVNGLGGRRWDIPFPEMGNRFSHFAVDFDFGDGLRCASYGRREEKAGGYVVERFVGTKGVFETSDINNVRITGAKAWESPKSVPQCLVEEHAELLRCVRNGVHRNMLSELTDSTYMAIAGRESAYAGTRVKYDWFLMRSQKSYLPTEFSFGKKPIDPIPLPGIYKFS